jgi:hypothetical protein
MARKNSHKRRSSRRRNYKGGEGSPEFMLKTVGDSNTQFRNVMDNNSQSNVIVPLKGGTRRKRGGFWGSMGSIINQAIVPFSILGMQQTYRKKSSGGTRRRRH